MSLPKKEKVPKLSDGQHTASTIALCIVAFAHSYLLISVFPYRCVRYE